MALRRFGLFLLLMGMPLIGIAVKGLPSGTLGFGQAAAAEPPVVVAARTQVQAAVKLSPASSDAAYIPLATQAAGIATDRQNLRESGAATTLRPNASSLDSLILLAALMAFLALGGILLLRRIARTIA